LQIVSNGRRWGSVLAALLVVASCGSSGSRYLANRDEKVYLRVPRSWHDVKLSDEIQDPVLKATSDAKVISKSVVSPQEDAVSQNDLSVDTPFATMTVYETSGAFNQQMSASVVRRVVGFVPYDPMLPGDANQGLSEVLAFDPSPSNAKVSGSHVVFRARGDTTSDWALTVNLSTYFDPSKSRLYALEVICTPDCYDKSAGQIDKIVNSWRIG
jgi:hypothetical protein